MAFGGIVRSSGAALRTGTNEYASAIPCELGSNAHAIRKAHACRTNRRIARRSRLGGIYIFGRSAPFGARLTSRKTRSYSSRRRAGRFDLCRVSRWPHDADRRRRRTRLDVYARTAVRARISAKMSSRHIYGRAGVKRVDVIALYARASRSLDGLRAILKDFTVSELWVGLDSDAPAFRDLLDEAKAHGVKIVHHYATEKFDFGAVQCAIAWPPAPGGTPLTENNDSLVISLQDGTTRFLLPGDVEAKAEKELSSGDENVRADFLKVPHHGSKSSSTEPFLEGVAPRFAVISVGEGNPFGHPNDSVVERYEERAHEATAHGSGRRHHRAERRAQTHGEPVSRFASAELTGLRRSKPQFSDCPSIRLHPQLPHLQRSLLSSLFADAPR